MRMKFRPNDTSFYDLFSQSAQHLVVGAGLGLLIGVQLDGPERTEVVMNALRNAGVLVGRTGPRNDVLKIRPPLVFGTEEADVLIAALDAFAGMSSRH